MAVHVYVRGMPVVSDSPETREKKRAAQIKLRRLRQAGFDDARAGRPKASEHPSYLRGYRSGTS